MTARIIGHVDLDAFFASVVIADNPDLKDKPVIIGADPQNGKGRGVVSTCNYIAREYGIHSAMPISQAWKRCPHGVFVRPDFKRIREVAEAVFNLLERAFPSATVKRTSIDEAYITFPEEITFDTAITKAKQLQKDIEDQLGVTLSIGLANTSSVAKIASDYNKPNGLTVVPFNNYLRFLNPLPVEKISGVGKKSKEILNEKYAIHTIGQIANLPDLPSAVMRYGSLGNYVWSIAHGKKTPWGRKGRRSHSISSERTFSKDCSDYEEIWKVLEELMSKIVEKASKDWQFRTIGLKIRFSNFETFTRSISISGYSRSPEIAISALKKLLHEFRVNYRPVRLVGAKLSNLKAIDKKIKTIPSFFP